MKLWVDDVRPVPNYHDGYVHCKSVNETINFIINMEKHLAKAMQICNEVGPNAKSNSDVFTRTIGEYVEELKIEIIDIDHDAGDYANDGGDYIKLLDWLEETGRNYPIRIHSMNVVGRENMRAIIRRNGWKEVI
jgi:hypothetical protein